MKIKDIKDDLITREDLGDIDALAESIVEVGLLQAIGVDTQGNLLWGKRRLAAAKLLEWEEIAVKVIDGVNKLDRAKIEKIENEQRKDYTPSEKVKLAEKLKEAYGHRQGRRTDLDDGYDELAQDFAEVKGETRAKIAEDVGFSNHETMRQAKAVVDSGNEEIIEKMDSGEVSINKAYNEVKPKPQVVFELDLPNDVRATLNMLEAAIRRCTTCPEPLTVLNHLRGLL